MFYRCFLTPRLNLSYGRAAPRQSSGGFKGGGGAEPAPPWATDRRRYHTPDK